MTEQNVQTVCLIIAALMLVVLVAAGANAV